MKAIPRRSLLGWLVAAGVGAGAGIGAVSAGQVSAESYVLEVQDVEGEVGRAVVLPVRVRLRDGLRFLSTYRHRAIELSAADKGVQFASRVVRGRLEDGVLVFEIPAVPTAPGPHVINGVLRVGYFVPGRSMHMVSIPLVARISGRAG